MLSKRECNIKKQTLSASAWLSYTVQIKSEFYKEVLEMSAVEQFKLELTEFEKTGIEIQSEKEKGTRVVVSKQFIHHSRVFGST